MEYAGEKIKERRLALGMTQTELAAAAGYADKGMISRIESGKVTLTEDRIRALAVALDTTPGALLGDSSQERLERLAHSFSYCFEQMAGILGWNYLYDSEGNVILSRGEKNYSITEDDIKNAEKMTAMYIEFLMEQIANKQ